MLLCTFNALPMSLLVFHARTSLCKWKALAFTYLSMSSRMTKRIEQSQNTRYCACANQLQPSCLWKRLELALSCMPANTMDFVSATLVSNCVVLNWYTLWRDFFSFHGNADTMCYILLCNNWSEWTRRSCRTSTHARKITMKIIAERLTGIIVSSRVHACKNDSLLLVGVRPNRVHMRSSTCITWKTQFPGGL